MPNIWILGADALAIALAVVLAFLLRFDGSIPSFYLQGGLQGVLALILLTTLVSFWLLRLYSFSWGHVGITDILSLGKAVMASAVVVGVLFLMFPGIVPFSGLPRSVFLMSYVLIFFFTSGIRLGKRIWGAYVQNFGNYNGERMLIVGAGDAGAELLRSVLASGEYVPVGFVDDDAAKRGTSIHGVRVLGAIEEIPSLAAEHKVTHIVIALPSAGSESIKRAVEAGRKAGILKMKIVPPLAELIHGEVSLQQLREVEVKDLLGREPLFLDSDVIERFLTGKKVLITGAAGSIGSELARQALKFVPSSLVLVDQDESGLFMMGDELRRRGVATELVVMVADIRNGERMEQVFEELRPEVVFHAAAYKHVPLMEQYPEEAVRTNVLGTGVVAKAAMKTGTEIFVYVSTDKVVNPTSVMGASKRFGEMVCQLFNKKGNTRFVAVRFGNVLDSRGSVIPLFRSQLKRGGPVEVTHPDMQRYFMLTAEACLLVMQASAIGQGGEVFVLDMGKPVKILDLAHEMIRLSGLEPDKDIPVVFSGMRPGEKLFEELLTAEEGIVETPHPKVFVAKLPLVQEQQIMEGLEKLKKACGQGNQKELRLLLAELVPSYTPFHDENYA
ncbi:MAG: hypothetical protein A2672_03185 [Candidatus Wildermuthbacteria bacterium RIFCSPHIGHO2_01_FULL_49_22b]|uniref:Polysaccharide biosynthesis protein CapD-like domain-containing protein n=1 Tax=Candidatus Wildermuthbacteria bacterium RIFCSPHIGHO2_01_FULL_49_22b TaxID=1802448 RepID=A0A1G2QX31_9BACT|nr:MAG: hypothetical protein A2672_03185 [Candidatus Wildermuthbacteria bacterium RIFCSPHIGHO2_01_FULL_49_22b]